MQVFTVLCFFIDPFQRVNTKATSSHTCLPISPITSYTPVGQTSKPAAILTSTRKNAGNTENSRNLRQSLRSMWQKSKWRRNVRVFVVVSNWFRSVTRWTPCIQQGEMSKRFIYPSNRTKAKIGGVEVGGHESPEVERTLVEDCRGLRSANYDHG